MKKLLLIFVFLFLNLSAEVITNTIVKTATGTGFGLSREEAINNAIIEALGKIQGVKIKSTKILSTTAVTKGSKSDLQDVYSSNISRITNGRVDGFSVDNITEFDGRFEADVTIKKIKTSKKYKTPGLDPNNRRKIAVFPVFSDKNYFVVLNQKISKYDLTNPLTQDILSAITNTRKFTVLDRVSDSNVYDIEESIISSKQAARDEIFKLGNVLGADYILTVNISDFSVSKNSSSITQTQNKINARIEYRVLTMATRQVKFAKVKNFSFNVSTNSLNNEISKITQKMAYDISAEIIDTIYPIKIADVINGEVIISQNLKVGEIYEVFSQGKQIVDPYTKEIVSRIENRVGSIEIIRLNSKISYAKILDGSVRKGDICRKNGGNVGIGKDSGVKIKNSGGVELPF
ncbi:hypothetical protein F1B92_02885 [Campylobacter sp. FMV-PI01]|uniref:Flagellar assembly protein T N-terminal domain-containing protein n=1 Tax=Campylobacter portucalensis TaxID=2608384 RepID=A0A6L5WGM1_9BACT|nr:hypothetical protein [Campylobacter portucalensis]MSN96149.1 hypothetical protein [Campylobacter portucalensis]